MKKLFSILFFLPALCSAQVTGTSEVRNLTPFVGTPSNPNNFAGFSIPMQPTIGGQYRRVDAAQLVASKIDSFKIVPGTAYDTLFTWKSGVKSTPQLIRAGVPPQLKTVNNQSLLGTGNITITGGTGGGYDSTDAVQKAAVIKTSQDYALPVDHMFDPNSFDANPDGGLDLWGHNRYPSAGTSIANLTVTLSGYSSYNAGVLILNTGSSAATIGAKTVFATINFVPNWPILPGSVTYSLEGDDAAQYLGSGNLVYTGALSTASCTLKLLNSSTIPANKTLYVHYKIMPGSNASGQ